MDTGNDLTKALERFWSERDKFYQARGDPIGGGWPFFHAPLPMLKAGSYAVASLLVRTHFDLWVCPSELWLVDVQECVRINYYDEASELRSWEGPIHPPMKAFRLFELTESVFTGYLNHVRSPEVEEYTFLFVETTPVEIMPHCRKYSEHFLDWLFQDKVFSAKFIYENGAMKSYNVHFY